MFLSAQSILRFNWLLFAHLIDKVSKKRRDDVNLPRQEQRCQIIQI